MNERNCGDQMGLNDSNWILLLTLMYEVDIIDIIYCSVFWVTREFMGEINLGGCQNERCI